MVCPGLESGMSNDFSRIAMLLAWNVGPYVQFSCTSSMEVCYATTAKMIERLLSLSSPTSTSYS